MKRTDGFTLFEVLGAVSLLAIVYTMLSTTAIRGLRSEGESRRILEASLIADWQLGEIEMQLDQGLVPELGVTETEDDDGYRIRAEIATFELPEIETPGGGLLAAGTSDSVSLQAQSTPLFGRESPLLEIVLVVSWGDPEDPRSISRTTYGFDATAIRPPPNAAGGAAPATGSAVVPGQELPEFGGPTP